MKVSILKTELIILFILIISTTLSAVEPEFLQVSPKSGDGIMSILRRYHLIDSECDVKEFYRLNKLNKKSKLYTDRSYKLPIFKYEYNGKSIRSTIGINNWDKAIRIRDYNKLLFSQGIKPTKFTQGKKVLWVPYREIYCDEIVKIQPIKSSPTGKRIYPIFGKKYEKTPRKSKKLDGHVYYIVSGHGGPDPGAIGKYGKYNLCEDEYAYDVSLRLCRKLVEHGAVAYMITRDENDGIREGKILPCDKDETAWRNQNIFSRQKPRLLQRSSMVNQLYERHRLSGAKKQMMIAIHIDSRSVGQRTDVFFYYHSSSPKGKKTAYKLQNKMKEKYAIYRKSKEYTGTVSARDLHMLRETKPVSVYIELGNIKNPSDQKRFILESNRELLSKWLFEGLNNFVP